MKWAALLFLGVALAAVLTVVAINPEKRLEALVTRLLEANAPAGTKIGEIRFGFPSKIELTRIEVPVRVKDRRRLILLENLVGRISFFPLLRRKVDAVVDTNFFGGTLWLDIRTGKLSTNPDEDSQQVVVDVRARNLDISQLCTFFQSTMIVSGRCDVDIVGKLNGSGTTNFGGKLLAVGNDVDVPPINIEKVILPENRHASVSVQASARGGKISVAEFRLEGSGYDLVGTGTVLLAEPPENSPLDGYVSVVLKDKLTIKDDELRRNGADTLAEALVTARSKVFFTVAGTIEDPVIQLDSVSSLGSLLQQFSR